MARHWRPLAMLCCATLAASPALTQPVASVGGRGIAPVTAGDEVKVRADGAIGRFRVVEVRERALVLRGRYDDTTRTIPMDAVRRLWLSRGPYTRTQGAGRGFARGATIGSLLGPFTMGTPANLGGPDAVEQAVTGAVIGAILGGLVGGAIGTIVPGTNWERLPLVVPRVDARGSVGLLMGLDVRF
jgi:hypothetical protein